jgi:hypothetical protein
MTYIEINMRTIIFLLIISLFFSCKSKDDAVKLRNKRINPHKLHKYPAPTIYHKKWEN